MMRLSNTSIIVAKIIDDNNGDEDEKWVRIDIRARLSSEKKEKKWIVSSWNCVE